MGTGRAALQVGIMVFLGIVLFMSGYAFFRRAQGGNESITYSIVFTDAQGMTAGSEVDYSGVKVGEVSEVGINPAGKAVIGIQIDKNHPIPQNSAVSVTSSLLGGSAAVQIMPPSTPPVSASDYYAPGATIAGANSIDFAALQSQAGQMMGQVGTLMSQLKTTSEKANALLDQATLMTKSMNAFINNPKIKGSVEDMAQNLDGASAQALGLTEQMRDLMNDDNKLLAASLKNADSATGQMAGIVSDNRTKFNQMMTSLNQSTNQMDALITQTNKTITAGNTVQNFSDTMANMKAASDQLNKMMADLESITGDKTVQTNLKTTIANAATLSAHTDQLVTRLNALAQGHTAHFDFHPQMQLAFLQNFGAHQFRTDLDLYSPIGLTDFARVGVRGLTETNQVNLQYGVQAAYNRRVSYRAGIYASKIGVGADYDVFGPNHFSVDLYDPNLLRLDIKDRIPVTPSSGIWLGLENVPRTNQITLGFDLRK